MREEERVEPSDYGPRRNIIVTEIRQDVLDAVEAAVIRKHDEERAVSGRRAQDDGARLYLRGPMRLHPA